MKTIIAGSRDITDYKLLEKAIKDSGFKITEVFSGLARGVDRLGEIYAKKNNLQVVPFLANWTGLGKKAGILRNIKMAEQADALIALWDGESRGTAHMISEARRKGLKVYVEEIQ